MARSKSALGIVVAVLATMMNSIAPAVAMNVDGRTQFRISGTVRTICRVQFDTAAAIVEGDNVDFGRMTEFCNNAEGYTVVINTPKQLDGATLYVDGIATPLSESGTTVVVNSTVPNWQRRSITLNLNGNNPAAANVSFRAQAKGLVY